MLSALFAKAVNGGLVRIDRKSVCGSGGLDEAVGGGFVEMDGGAALFADQVEFIEAVVGVDEAVLALAGFFAWGPENVAFLFQHYQISINSADAYGEAGCRRKLFCDFLGGEALIWIVAEECKQLPPLSCHVHRGHLQQMYPFS